MRYFLLREQSGGCDYTIGCGMTFYALHATNKKDAIKEVIGLNFNSDWKEEITKAANEEEYSIDDYIHDYVMGEGCLGDIEPGEHQLCGITLYEVSDEIDMIPQLQAVSSQLKNWQRELETKATAAAEIALFEKLKKKLGK